MQVSLVEHMEVGKSKMNKLKIRITKFDTQSKAGRFFHDTEETIFLHEMDEERFFSLLNAIGKVDGYGKDVKGNEAWDKAIEDKKPESITDRPLNIPSASDIHKHETEPF